MSPEATAHSLRLTRVVRAHPERVFRALTEPDELKHWFCPEGGTVKEVEVDLTVGGRFRVVMAMPDGDHEAAGVYRQIEPPRRVVCTWTWIRDDEEQGEETLLTFELEPREDATEVILTHERLPSAESRDSHEGGWSSALNRLEALFS
ncbi:MAG TPA: SRPBCC domain-containing protein [Gemmatimonadota bacterium]|nr:SRPBCC domain-containing protein [Gemmatimonadota bacterium]